MSTSTTTTRAVIIELKTADHLHPTASRDAYHTVRPRITEAVAPWQLSPVFTSDRTDEDYVSTCARSSVPDVCSDPRRFLRVRVPAADANELVLRLRGLPEVHAAYVEPTVRLPMMTAGVSATGPGPVGATRDFSSQQTYLDDAPVGLGVRFAWTRAQGGPPGAGVRGADVELGWVRDHEDFPSPASARIVIVNDNGDGGAAPNSEDAQHGTASLGIGVALDNGQGITGIAPGVETVFCSATRDENTADAIALAASKLSAGDVLLIELEAPAHDPGPSIPVEFSGHVFAAIRNATNSGIVVVEPAGNGGVSLDTGFDGAFDLAVRDSGAIIVGAGAPAGVEGMPDLSRVPLSNCGNRVDVQGYGGLVVTTGFGDLQGPMGGDVRRWYTKQFDGTSSAAAMVWGVCLLIQSLLIQHHRPVLSPRDMRDLLRTTGRPQAPGKAPGTSIAARVGPRPDLRRALESLRLA